MGDKGEEAHHLGMSLFSNNSSEANSKIFHDTLNPSGSINMSSNQNRMRSLILYHLTECVTCCSFFVFVAISGDLSLHRGLPFQCSHFSPDGPYQHTECECAIRYLEIKMPHLSSVTLEIISLPLYVLKGATARVVQHSVEFEEALAALTLMTAPIAPHLASELWAGW